MYKSFLLALTVLSFSFSTPAAFASDCTAPVLLYQLKSADAYYTHRNEFGFSVDAIGDLNDDGKPDFIVGAPRANLNAIGYAGSVYVYSGADGNLLYQIDGTTRYEFLGQSVAALSDINGDGISDFIAGAIGNPNSLGHASVYSGVDGSLLFRFDIPFHSSGNIEYDRLSVAGVGDINEDGKADFIVGIPYANLVFIYSGADGSLLYQLNGDSRAEFGHSVAGIGDVNGDGKSDFIVGADWALQENGRVGSAFIYSGADIAVLYQKNGVIYNQFMGYSVASLGDLDKDGINDFIVGAPLFGYGGFPFDSGSVYVYSDASGSLLFEKKGRLLQLFGHSVSSAGDVNLDGTPDFIVGAPGDHDLQLRLEVRTGSAYVYSGVDGSLIYQVRSFKDLDFFGFSAASAGDLNGDGKSDIIVSAPQGSVEGDVEDDSGAVYIFVSKTVPKGDLNFDSMLTLPDVVALLNVVFIDNSTALCPCTADLNCDGFLTSSDVVLELNAVFLGVPITGTP